VRAISAEMYRNGIPRAHLLDQVEGTLKSLKIGLVQLGHRKIFKGFGQPANPFCFIVGGSFIVMVANDGLFCVSSGSRLSWKDLMWSVVWCFWGSCCQV
jgi:hypothetical protein